MKLEWIGHACFRITAGDGTTVVTDPYDDSVGIEQPELRADLITMSHEHHDHNCTEHIAGSPVIARGLEAAAVGCVKTQAVGSFHDGERGAKRGPNAIRLFFIDGLKIVHMGDQGCMPDEQALSAIQGADVMMIPAGGTYTVDAEGARAILLRARPRCVVPMHVKTRRCGYPIAPVTEFLRVMGAEGARPVLEAELSLGNVPEGVLLMQPQADAL
ncbi:MAG: MBL fold metallo-hydrolase [Clostridia bacterium]|nr:MBL fold metallo-hydrolase [Clostridia bacterium]